MASTLARVSNNATIPEHDKVVAMCLREAAYFIEWSAPQVPPEFLLELAAMQREILAWRRVWPIEAARSLLATLDGRGLGLRDYRCSSNQASMSCQAWVAWVSS
jgi:hypothetical protein